jgi:hypothetical protein
MKGKIMSKFLKKIDIGVNSLDITHGMMYSARK